MQRPPHPTPGVVTTPWPNIIWSLPRPCYVAQRARHAIPGASHPPLLGLHLSILPPPQSPFGPAPESLARLPLMNFGVTLKGVGPCVCQRGECIGETPPPHPLVCADTEVCVGGGVRLCPGGSDWLWLHQSSSARGPGSIACTVMEKCWVSQGVQRPPACTRCVCTCCNMCHIPGYFCWPFCSWRVRLHLANPLSLFMPPTYRVRPVHA